MRAINFLRLETRPPTVKLPPQGEVVIYFNATTGAIVAKDSAGATVSFSGSGGGTATFTDLTVTTILFSDNVNAGLTSSTLALASGDYNAAFSPTTLTAVREYTTPDAAGMVPVVPSYVDLTAANTALAAGDYWWDTTLQKLRIATA